MSTARGIPDAVEVLVVGTGAAGLVAATAAADAGIEVLCIDSADEFGGTTALSGGRVWIPANGRPENTGDSREQAMRYLEQIFDTSYRGHIETFVDSVNEAADFVERSTPHRFVVCPDYPDYHTTLDGATLGGRCFDVGLLELDMLVPQAAQVRYAPSYSPLTHAEWERWRYPQNFDHELLRRRREQGVITGGPGLAAALVDGAVRAGVRVEGGTTLLDVVLDGDAVSAALVSDSAGQHLIETRAVIVATGGYDGDAGLRNELMPRALAVSASAPTNTGVALHLARRHGLDFDNLGNGWWMPMVEVLGETVHGAPYPRGLIRERGVPHMIVVNGQGERCLSESLPYNEFGKAVHTTTTDGEVPNLVTWLLLDQQFRDRYPLPGLNPGGPLPANIVTADSLSELAALIAVDPDTLAQTVETWNRDCDRGTDSSFGRGDNAYDRYYGDPSLQGNRSMGRIVVPPYYATRVFSGTISSKGGPVCTVDGLAQRPDGSIVAGLYVAGTAAAFWTSDGYPGPGTPLSLSITFGYRAGCHAARACLEEAPT